MGTSEFGWYFGSVLGEDKVSPGVRKTYVLVALNGECLQSNRLLIVQTSLEWTKGLQSTPQAFQSASWSVPVMEDTMKLRRMEYTPVAYTAPTTLVPAVAQPVILLLTFDKRVDQAITITANGVNLYRVRDDFARATPPSSGITNFGLLESQTPSARTWTLVGDRELLIRLDPTQYFQGLPDLLFTTPRGKPKYLSDYLKGSPPDVEVYGHPFVCGTQELLVATNCSVSQLPPPGVIANSMPRKIYATRYNEPAAGGSPEDDQINLTVGSAPATAGPVSGTAIQVIQQGVGHLWSTASYAMLYDRDIGTWFSLSCNQGTFRLECKVPNLVDHEHRFNVYTADGLYDSGAISGPVELTRCEADPRRDPCKKPSIWSINTPVEVTNRSQWTMAVELQGACPEDPYCAKTTVELRNPTNGAFKPVTAHYKSGFSYSDLRVFEFEISRDSFGGLGDVMVVDVRVNDGQNAYLRIGPVLSAVSPIVRTVTTSADGKPTQITGINLIFSGVRVSSSGKTFDATCSSSNGSDWCSYPSNLGSTAGPLFFVLKSEAGGPVIEPLRQLAADGVTVGTTVTYSPPSKKTPAAAKTPGAATTTITIMTGPPAATSPNTQTNAQMAVAPALTASFFTGATSSLQSTDQISATPNQNPTQMYIVPQ